MKCEVGPLSGLAIGSLGTLVVLSVIIGYPVGGGGPLLTLLMIVLGDIAWRTDFRKSPVPPADGDNYYRRLRHRRRSLRVDSVRRRKEDRGSD